MVFLSTHGATSWVVAATIVAFLVTLWDKNRARRREWRVPESSLWLIAVLGGSASMFLTMVAIRHKTRHARFMIGLPLLTLAQIALIYLMWRTNFLIIT